MCFFATDIHSATLGKGKSDDTLIRVRNGDLKGKAELVVCLFNSFRVYMGLLSQTNPRLKMIFGKQVNCSVEKPFPHAVITKGR